MKLLILILPIFLSACGVLNFSLESTISTSAPSVAPPTPIELTPQNFMVVYDGEGHVDFNSDNITMAPKASTAGSETHASLVMLQQTIDTPLQDFELVVDLEVTQQLRQNTAANDWEVFWLFFSYNGSVTGKTTNYYISKPVNGSELGLAHGELGQNFISTDAATTTAVGSRHKFKFVRVDNKFTVHRDGTFFYSFEGNTAFPKKMYASKGSLGFYSEDAEVKIYSVALKNLDGAQSTAPTLPLLASISPVIKPPQEAIALSVAVNNLAQVGNLFWSCNFKRVFGNLNVFPNLDCLGNGTMSASGAFEWTPLFSDIGSWFFNFEASEQNSGFAREKVYLQVRPTWTTNQQLFLYDAQFSLPKTWETKSVLVAREIATTDNNRTDPWPGLTNADTMDLSGLNETAPWIVDVDTGLAALHFDANQDPQGLPLPVSNLGNTKELRLSYWFKRDDNNSKSALLVNHTNGVFESSHWWGVISSRYTDGGAEVLCMDTTPATDDWTFVTSQVTGSLMKTYVNGREVCSQSLPATYDFSSPFRVAPQVQGPFAFAGLISEIAGYKQSTAAEIFADFAATAERYRRVKIGAITQNDLVLHWDAANAESGIRPSSTATPSGWADLTSDTYSKIMGGFDGTPTSGFVTTTPANSSMAFDGVNDYIQLNTNASLSLGPTWTIEAWLKPGVALGVDNSFPPNHMNHPLFKTIFEKATYDNANKLSQGFGMRIGTNNELTAFIVNNYGFTDTVASVESLDINQWYHVAVSFDKNTSKIGAYINGVLKATKIIDIKRDQAGTPQADGDVIGGLSNTFVGIPADADGRRRYNGNLAILRVYKSALTDAKIKAHCKAQNARFGVTCN